MDLFTIIGACVRRWYVTLPVLALAVFGAWKAYESVAPVYSSSVSIAVLPAAPVPDPTPTAPGAKVTPTPVPENPYAGSGGPRFAAAVLARNIDTGTYRNQVGLSDRSDVTYTASASTQEPIIKIDATGPTPETVTDVLDRITGQAGVVLNEFQTSAGAAPEALYRLAIAVPADTVSDVTPSRWRNAGAIVALGLALAAILATALDVALRRRPSARRRRVEDEDAPTRTDEEGAAAVVRSKEPRDVAEGAGPRIGAGHSTVIPEPAHRPADERAMDGEEDALEVGSRG